jgi:hypothetical protein
MSYQLRSKNTKTLRTAIRWIAVPVLSTLAVMGLPVLPGLDLLGRAQALDYRSTVLADGPMAYWRMGDTGGGWADETGSVGPGTWSGSKHQGQPGAIAGDTDTATSLDAGASVYIDPNTALSTAQFTAESWVKTAPGSTGLQSILKYTRDYGMGCI